MDKLYISIFGNEILSEIISEIKLFSKFKIKYYDNLDLCIKDAENYNQLIIIFTSKAYNQNYKKFENNSSPLIFIADSPIPKNILSSDL